MRTTALVDRPPSSSPLGAAALTRSWLGTKPTDAALATVSAAIPIDWRRGTVERADLARFMFAPDDVIIVVGQDGLVANVAKYLDGQPVIGINTDTVRNPGVLVAHQPDELAELLRSRDDAEVRTMVEAITDDGQELRALNEIYLGHPSHQTARYTITPPDAPAEPQASSGLIVATGTGATGWCRSVWLEHHSTLTLPQPTDPRLAWFVREAWPSPVTGTSCTEGELTDSGLAITIESEHLVLFGDGIETDNIGADLRSAGHHQTSPVRPATRPLSAGLQRIRAPRRRGVCRLLRQGRNTPAQGARTPADRPGTTNQW